MRKVSIYVLLELIGPAYFAVVNETRKEYKASGMSESNSLVQVYT